MKTIDKKYSPLRNICVIIFLASLGYGSIYPVIPAYSKELGASTFLSGLNFGSFTIMFSIFSIIGGHYYEKNGGEKIIKIGILLLSFGVFSFVLIKDADYFIIFNGLCGAGVGFVLPSEVSLMYEITDDVNRAKRMSIFISIIMAGFTLGNICGGFIAETFSSSASFHFAAICLAGSFLSSGNLGQKFFFRESIAKTQNSCNYKKMIEQEGMKALLWRSFASLFVAGTLLAIVPLFLSEMLNLTQGEVGMVIGIEGLFMFISTPVGGVLSDKVGRKFPITISGFVVASALVLFCLVDADNFYFALLPAIILGIGVGINNPASISLIGELSASHKKGTGMGLYAFVGGFGLIAGSILSGVLYSFESFTPFLIGAGMSVVSSLLILLFVPDKFDRVAGST